MLRGQFGRQLCCWYGTGTPGIEKFHLQKEKHINVMRFTISQSLREMKGGMEALLMNCTVYCIFLSCHFSLETNIWGWLESKSQGFLRTGSIRQHIFCGITGCCKSYFCLCEYKYDLHMVLQSDHSEPLGQLYHVSEWRREGGVEWVTVNSSHGVTHLWPEILGSQTTVPLHWWPSETWCLPW